MGPRPYSQLPNLSVLLVPERVRYRDAGVPGHGRIPGDRQKARRLALEGPRLWRAPARRHREAANSSRIKFSFARKGETNSPPGTRLRPA